MMGRIVYYRLVLFETTDSEDPKEIMKDLKERASTITAFCKEKGFGVSSFNMESGGSTTLPTEQESAGEQG